MTLRGLALVITWMGLPVSWGRSGLQWWEHQNFLLIMLAWGAYVIFRKTTSCGRVPVWVPATLLWFCFLLICLGRQWEYLGPHHSRGRSVGVPGSWLQYSLGLAVAAILQVNWQMLRSLSLPLSLYDFAFHINKAFLFKKKKPEIRGRHLA